MQPTPCTWVPTGMLRSGRLLDVRARTGLHRVALLEVLRRDDVPLLAVGVVQQRDPRSGSGRTRCARPYRHAVLVDLLEVDQAVLALGPPPWWRVVIRPWALRHCGWAAGAAATSPEYHE
jgi:hypothetical protein